MPMIVIGGQHRKIGKTALVTAILRDFAQLHWQAAKFTSHTHDPGECELFVRENGFCVWQQSQAARDTSTFGSLQSHPTDTAQYLAAGAAEAFLIQYKADSLKPSCRWLRSQIPDSEPMIAEGTSAAEFIVPDLFLMILDPGSKDFKSSAARLLSRADACVLPAGAEPRNEALRSLTAGKPLIHLGLQEDQETLRNLICERILSNNVRFPG